MKMNKSNRLHKLRKSRRSRRTRKTNQKGGERCNKYNIRDIFRNRRKKLLLHYIYDVKIRAREDKPDSKDLKLGCLEKEPEKKEGVIGTLSNLTSGSRIRTFYLRVREKTAENPDGVFSIIYKDEENDDNKSTEKGKINVSNIMENGIKLKIKKKQQEKGRNYIEIHTKPESVGEQVKPGRVYRLFIPDKSPQSVQSVPLLQQWKSLFDQIISEYTKKFPIQKTGLDQERMTAFKEEGEAMKLKPMSAEEIAQKEPTALGGGKSRKKYRRKTARKYRRKSTRR